MAFLLSTLGVLLRDTKDLVGLYLLVGLYMAPIFYHLEWAPKWLRSVIYLNPATWFINCFRDVLYYGFIPDWTSWIIASGISILCLLTGCLFFNRFKSQFGNFL
jgi:lipopolysaccharide transport system permease protein